MENLLETIATHIEEHYLFPDKAPMLAEAVRKLGLLSGINNEIADAITEELVRLSSDKHFLLRHAPDEIAGQADHEVVMKAHTDQARKRNFGFETIQRLTGNIAYWKLNELPPVAVAGDMVNAVIVLVKNMDALILDLRDCEGGTPEMVQYIASIFLVGGVSLSGVESRKYGIKTVETLSDTPFDKMLEKPLIILIGARTFSAGEALAYDLQAHQRAQIIGQKSRGGAHLSDFFPIDNRWLLRLPVARALNPITGGNWERVGVIPDIESDDPLATAIQFLQDSI